jgi:hypothetical protein
MYLWLAVCDIALLLAPLHKGFTLSKANYQERLTFDILRRKESAQKEYG